MNKYAEPWEATGMRIAVFGAGGAGGYFGAPLARSGEEVIFIARGEHLKAIREHGLRVETPDGEIVARSEATDDPAQVGAVVMAALGYAEGGRLAREMGGAQVICWALLVSAPFLVPPVAWAINRHGLAASPTAWLGLAYVGVFSMFLGFVAWYRGMALGGIARVSQIQLLQPFLTIFASALLLGERVTLVTIGFSLAVVACVAVGRHASVSRSGRP
jgi:drug/metabolite transporter (DMT)-like permease